MRALAIVLATAAALAAPADARAERAARAERSAAAQRAPARTTAKPARPARTTGPARNALRRGARGGVHALPYGQLGYVLLPPDGEARGALGRQVGRLRRLFPTEGDRVATFTATATAAIEATGATDLAAIRAAHPGQPIIAIQLNRMQQLAGTKQEMWHARAIAARIKRAGGVPVFLPPAVALGRAARAHITDGADAILLAGGDDIDPRLYGEGFAGARDTNRRRDVPEMRLLDAALDAGVPVTGICRGCQMIAVATGGALEQHIDRPGHGSEDGPEAHPVTTAPGTRARGLLGQTTKPVASLHHQAVKRTGPGMAITGRAPDGTAEVIEGRGALGVQFHPEKRTDPTVDDAFFDDLMQRARDHQAARGR